MSFFWYDYETLGPSVSDDRPAQFAGVRTDEDLRVIDDPLALYCRPTPDYLPDPDSCLVHGISPAMLMDRGLSEAEFADRIYREITQPDTCCVGYNAIRFDHEITRFLMYRNLRDPYEWHWKNGNSRWDIIDLLRAAFALRPDGINWPTREDDAPSFRLEDIAAANDVDHESPHEALADVKTTLAVARLVKRSQPKLFEYYLRLRSKQAAAGVARKPFVLVSSFIPARLGCASIVAPICRHPTNKSAVIVFDLRYDPSDILDLTSNELREALFTRRADMPEGRRRAPLSIVRTNACPFVAPLEIVDERIEGRLDLEIGRCREHYSKLKAVSSFHSVVRNVYTRTDVEADIDVDAALYSGGFLPDKDRRLLDRLLETGFSDRHEADFDDDRLEELVFRFRARNHPHSLDEEESERWNEHCRARHTMRSADGRSPLEAFGQRIAELRSEHSENAEILNLLDELAGYGEQIRTWIA